MQVVNRRDAVRNQSEGDRDRIALIVRIDPEPLIRIGNARREIEVSDLLELVELFLPD